MDSKLQELTNVINCNFTLDFNPHKSSYEDAETYITEMGNSDGFYDEVGELDYTKDIWTIQVYPHTPIGFISGVSNNLDELLDWAIEGSKNY